MQTDVHYHRIIKVPQSGLDLLKELLADVEGELYIDVDDDSAFAMVTGDDCDVEELDAVLAEADIEVIVSITMTDKLDDDWTDAHWWSKLDPTILRNHVSGPSNRRIVEVPDAGFDALKAELEKIGGSFWIQVGDDMVHGEVTGYHCSQEDLDAALASADVKVVVAMTLTDRDDPDWREENRWTTFVFKPIVGHWDNDDPYETWN